jgi:cytochrome c oxidase assembly protein subunit 17
VASLKSRCCACPETKALRDDCFLKTSPDLAEENCKEFLEKHKACMRGYGFKV